MEIRHFITFKTILETGSYSKAATKLNYSQSTITSHIQHLEQELGGALFNFVQRQAELTTIGQQLLPLANKILDTHEDIRKIKNKGNISGELRIAAPETITIYRLESILREFTKKYPDVKIILSNGTCSKNQVELLEGNVDIAFMIWPKLKQNNVVDYCLSEEEIVFIANKEKPDQLPYYLNEENNEYFITNEVNSCYNVLFQKFLTRNEITHIKTMELWSVEAIKKAIIGGLGFSFLPMMCVKNEIKTRELKLVKHNVHFEKAFSHMLIKSKKWQPAAVGKFVEIALSHARLW